MQDYKNILIIKMSSLGDVIHALPTVAAIRKNWPHAHITWAVHEAFAPLIPGKPYVDRILLVDRKQLKKLSYLWKLREELHAQHFDISIDLQCLAKSALVAFLSGAKEKYGYWELREGSRFVNTPLIGPNQYGHVIERYLDTVRMLGGSVDEIIYPLPDIGRDKRNVLEKLKSKGLTGRYIVVAPGARWATKEWPAPLFGKFVKRLVRTGHFIVITGTKADREKSRVVCDIASSSKVIDMTGETTIRELMGLLQESDLFVGADTGPLHIANALGVPVIALFGATASERSKPYGKQPIEIVVSPLATLTEKDSGHKETDCMQAITVDSVWQAYESISKKTQTGCG